MSKKRNNYKKRERYCANCIHFGSCYDGWECIITGDYEIRMKLEDEDIYDYYCEDWEEV